MSCEHSAASQCLLLTLGCSLAGLLTGVPRGGGWRVLALVLLRVTEQLTEWHHAGARLVLVIKLTAGHLGVAGLHQVVLPHPLQVLLLQEQELGLVVVLEVVSLEAGGVVWPPL